MMELKKKFMPVRIFHLPSVKAFFLFFLIIISLVLFAFPAFAQENTTYEVPEKYISAVCAGACTGCGKNVGHYGAGLYDLCRQHTYQGIDDCRKKCIEMEDSDLIKNADLIYGRCKFCLSTDECKSNEEKGICRAIDSGRNMIELMQNGKLADKKDFDNPSFGCPTGAQLVGNECKCADPSAELDSLHTICLNKEAIKDKIKLTLLFLPDEIQEGIKDAIIKAIRADTTGGLLTGMADMVIGKEAVDEELKNIDLTDDKIVDYLYNKVIRDTNKIKELLIKVFEIIKVKKPSVSPSQVTLKATPKETVVEIDVQTNPQLQELSIIKCQAEGKACQKGCKGETKCDFDCMISAGCGFCRKDSDCTKFSNLVGYEFIRCKGQAQDPNGVGVCAVKAPK